MASPPPGAAGLTHMIRSGTDDFCWNGRSALAMRLKSAPAGGVLAKLE